MGLSASKLEDAHETVLEDERDGQRGARLDTVFTSDEAWILADVAYSQDPPLSSGGAGESLVQSKATAQRDGILISQGEHSFEELTRFVPDCDGEGMIVHQGLDPLGDAAEKLFEVEDGSQLTANIVEQAQSARMFGECGEKRRGDEIRVPAGAEAFEFREIVHYSWESFY